MNNERAKVGWFAALRRRTRCLIPQKEDRPMKQHKVLSAMLALREFTVRDLSLYSEVGLRTVSTIVARERHYLEHMGKSGTGKKGGQWDHWRVKADQLDNLKSRISKLFGEMKTSTGLLNEPESAPQVPTALLVAEDILLRLYPNADTPQKKRDLLELAEINFNSARAECENLISGNNYIANVEAIQRQIHSVEELLHKHTPEKIVQTHIHFFESLRVLSELEYDLDRNRDPTLDISIKALHAELTTASHELWELGGSNCAVAFDTMQRVANSPVINRALAW